jgi:hypothetical protein
MNTASPRILPTCTFTAAEAGLYGEGRRPCPPFADTFLAAGNGYVSLEWRGKELACVFPGNHVVVAFPEGLPLPGVVERLAALLPDDASLHIDDRSCHPVAVATVGGTAYALATGSLLNFYPWAANEPALLGDRLADFENAVAKARRLAGVS